MVKGWPVPDLNDVYRTYCKACDTDFTAGKNELSKHANYDAIKNECYR